jgi:pyruvate dehydrogenase E2 component (dihydrolipoamide acetyltransferase)
MGEFRMPSLGADMDEGTVVEWLVAEGDEVHRGDVVAVVDTDKADIEVEVFESGVVDELLVPIGAKVPVGTPLARLRAPGDVARERVAPDAASIGAPVASPADLHSPVLRRLARHLGVDVAGVRGTGPDGRITRADIEAAAERGHPASRPTPDGAHVASEAQPRDRSATMRSAIAELMARSAREIPHYYVALEIEAGTALGWLESFNAGRPPAERVLPAALLVKAAALAAREVPDLNGAWIDGRLRVGDRVHPGVAVRLRGGGVIAPALHDADRMTLPELMAALQDIVARARSGRLRSSEMTDATFTVTQLGDQGVDEVYGVISAPQVALVGFGRITDRPWAVGGLVGVRPVVRASLAGDHRATDGIVGARYLRAVDRLLHTPEQL